MELKKKKVITQRDYDVICLRFGVNGFEKTKPEEACKVFGFE